MNVIKAISLKVMSALLFGGDVGAGAFSR